MPAGMTLQEVLEKAIEKEIEAQELYRDLSEKVELPAAKDMFTTLSGVEKKHEDLLRRYAAGEMGEGALHVDHVVDYRIAEHFNAPAITPDMALPDVLLLAANREKASHDLYTGLATEHPEGKVRDIFLDLAAQELEHKHRVEDLYTEVAFPQTSGG